MASPVRPHTIEELSETFARRSVPLARGIIGITVLLYSLSSGFGGVESPTYASVISALVGAGFMISAVAEFLADGHDESARRWLIVLDVLLAMTLLFAFIEDSNSYEFIVLAWVVVEAGTAFRVGRTLAIAGVLAGAYIIKDLIAVQVFDESYDTGGILVRLATLAAVALVTSSFSTGMQSKRLLSEERGRSSELRELDEAKTMFIRAVAHDFRSPLAVITGMAELIGGRAGQMSDEQVQQLSGTILKNGRKLERLVSDLMDSERLSQGVLHLERVDTDLADLVRDAIEDVDMTYHVVDTDLPSVTASIDAPKVERVVENLLTNAAKHTPRGTQVWVSLEDAAGDVLIVVQDSGDGVPDDLKEEIFQPFVQGTENSPGTGVGLSLVRGIAELHGGSAWVEDRAGGGCVFKVLLPKEADAR